MCFSVWKKHFSWPVCFPDLCVFLCVVPEEFVPVYNPELEPEEIQAAPLKESKKALVDSLVCWTLDDLSESWECFLGSGFLTDCDFDRGACEWVQDHEDDLDWIIKYHENGTESEVTVSLILTDSLSNSDGIQY